MWAAESFPAAAAPAVNNSAVQLHLILSLLAASHEGFVGLADSSKELTTRFLGGCLAHFGHSFYEGHLMLTLLWKSMFGHYDRHVTEVAIIMA